MLLVASRWVSRVEPTLQLLGGAGAVSLFVVSFSFMSGRILGRGPPIFHYCCHEILGMVLYLHRFTAIYHSMFNYILILYYTAMVE